MRYRRGAIETLNPESTKAPKGGSCLDQQAVRLCVLPPRWPALHHSSVDRKLLSGKHGSFPV